jgi:hypothetical protein
MKKDLSHLLKKEEKVWGFEDLRSAKEYVAKYMLNYIHMELENLDTSQWDKTLTTWAKICGFSKALLDKGELQRKELYKRFNFDIMMEGIAEDIRHTLMGFLSLGILKADEPPYMLIPRAVELIIEEKELLQQHQLREDILRYILSFFERFSPKP